MNVSLKKNEICCVARNSGQQKRLKLQTFSVSRSFKKDFFLSLGKIQNSDPLAKNLKFNVRCNQRQKLFSSLQSSFLLRRKFGLKQKFQQMTTMNQTEFKSDLLTKSHSINFSRQQKKDPKISVKFLKSFLQTKKKVPGLRFSIKLDPSIDKVAFFEEESLEFSNCKNSFQSQKILPNQPQYKEQKALKSPNSSLFTHLISHEYLLNDYHRSNQDTLMVQRPIIYEGQWVEKGDILADSSASMQGELALGQNILVGYTPWEGYNFEDAVLISERLISDDLYTSIHIERYEVEVRDTKFGFEQITNQIPNQIHKNAYLDNNGLVKVGTWVSEGDVLVGKIAPLEQKKLTPYENLLYDIIGKVIPRTRDTSLRVPKGVNGRVIQVEIVETHRNIDT